MNKTRAKKIDKVCALLENAVANLSIELEAEKGSFNKRSEKWQKESETGVATAKIIKELEQGIFDMGEALTHLVRSKSEIDFGV